MNLGIFVTWEHDSFDKMSTVQMNLFERSFDPMIYNLSSRDLTDLLTVLHDQLSLRQCACKFLAVHLKFVHIHTVLLYKVI
jgi:hypothetical protein